MIVIIQKVGREWCARVCKRKRNNNANAYDDANAYDSAYANASYAYAIYAIDNYDFYVLDNFNTYSHNILFF